MIHFDNLFSIGRREGKGRMAGWEAYPTSKESKQAEQIAQPVRNFQWATTGIAQKWKAFLPPRKAYFLAFFAVFFGDFFAAGLAALAMFRGSCDNRLGYQSKIGRHSGAPENRAADLFQGCQRSSSTGINDDLRRIDERRYIDFGNVGQAQIVVLKAI